MDCPKLILRYGAHSEKEYFLKLCNHFDAVHINANLLEISKAATTSLIATTRTKHEQLGFYLNPVTYLFGPYVQPRGGSEHRDLDWIKSFSKKSNTRGIKVSYKALAEELGPIFSEAVSNECAIDYISLSESQHEELCRGVVGYQQRRLQEVASDDGMDEFKDLVTESSVQPSAIFAPYFYIADEWRSSGIEANITLASKAAELYPELPLHMLILMSPNTLQDDSAMESLVRGVQASGVRGVWIWVSNFNELTESLESLRKMRALVSELSEGLEVNMYAGGLWSMLLGHEGLSGVSHGVGYGEARDVISPIGGAAPTVRYYLPAIAKRVSVASIERCFASMRVTDADSLHETVCDCTICKGVIANDWKKFSSFGDMHRSASSTRDSQTPTAAKLCRYHFLIRRLQFDRMFVKDTDGANRGTALSDRAGEWPLQPTIKNDAAHLSRWADSFIDDIPTPI